MAGPGGAGKSTIAKLLEKNKGFVYLDGDRADTEFFPKGGQWLPENLESLRKAHDKILKLAKESFDSGQSVVVDYIIFGNYLAFFQKFKKEFGNNLEIKVLLPSFEENVKRDKERECWTTGSERIKTVRKEFEKIKNKLGKENFVDTSEQTPEETYLQYFNL